MNIKKSVAVFCLAVLVVVLGCETAPGSGLAGGALGAGLGAIIGHQSGHAGEGAVIGAVVGGLTGLIVHDVKSRRERTARETAEDYNYSPAQGQRLTFEHARVEPQYVRRGERVEATAQYALLGASNGARMTHTWTLRQGSRDLSQLSSYTESRTDGTWVTTLPFRVPQNLSPGEYQIVYQAHTDETSIFGTADFVVQ